MGQATIRSITGSGLLSILDVINPNRERYGQPSGFSSDDLGAEQQAQALFFPALKTFVAATNAAMELSELRKDHFHDLLRAVADAAPDELAWDEAIAEAHYE